jgi:hypothetical protein
VESVRAGSRLAGRYRLAERIGVGGMAEVWQGEDEVLARPVAVKLIDPALLADPAFRVRFRAEARAAAGLSHPHVVTVHDYGEEDGTPYLVMELLDGETLADRLRAGPLAPAAAATVCGQIAAALAAAHDAGLVHRDVKPANVFLTRGGVKVLDFGVAVRGETGPPLGTPAYLAPEQLPHRQVTAAADVFALGVVLFEVLAGRRPFGEDEDRTEPPPFPPDTPADLAALGARCLAGDAAARPTSAEVAAELGAPPADARAADERAADARAADMPTADTRTANPRAADERAGNAQAATGAAESGAAESGVRAAAPPSGGPAEPDVPPEPDAPPDPDALPATGVLPTAEVLPPQAAPADRADPFAARPPTPVLAEPGTRDPRRRVLLAAGGAAVAIALVVAFVIAGRGSDRPAPQAAPPASSPPASAPPASASPATASPAVPPAATQAPAATLDALNRMRRSVDQGAAAGQVRPDVALDFDNLISQLQDKLSTGQPVDDLGNRIGQLRIKIEQRLREGGLTAARAQELRAALSGIS